MKITIPEVTIRLPQATAVLSHWKWGVLAAVALVLMLSTVGPAPDAAANPGPGFDGMYLNVTSGGDCNSSPKPTKCDVLVGSSFTLSVGVNEFPAPGYWSFSSTVYYSGVTPKPAAAAVEVVWPDHNGYPWNSYGIAGRARHTASADFPSTYKGNIVEVTFNCPATPTSVSLDLYGELYVSEFDYYDSSDQLSINCVSLPEINITKLSATAPQPVPGSCFDVWDGGNTSVLFSVCDNDFQATFPESDPLCAVDGTPECEDADLANGSIQVAVEPGSYGVVEGKPPVNHTPDASKQPCAAAGGSKCDLAFTNVVIDAPSPWFPWDTTGDNAVSALDIFDVLAHFNETRP